MDGEIVACINAKAYDAALAMQFIVLDTWAYLTSPEKLKGRKAFEWFVERYLRDHPGQGYNYRPSDVYEARCGLLHTFGSIADLHDKDPSIVFWRYHLGVQHTYVPGLTRMAYISVMRFIYDARDAAGRALNDLILNPDMNQRWGERMPRVYHLAGILPSRDPDAVAAMEDAIDAEMAEMGGPQP